LFPELSVLYVQLIGFGIAIGVFSGLLGIGGGIMLVPGLMLLFQFSQQEAQGTSLAAMIPPIGIFAALVYYRNGFVQIPVAGAVAGGFMVGAYLGALALPHVPVRLLQLGFGGLLLYVGLSFLFAGSPTTDFRNAALPAGVTALLVAIRAWLRGKPAAVVEKLPPPDDRTEYHI
jgi:uncharacterized membrane protein YfcA